jgi:hypothetical protein
MDARSQQSPTVMVGENPVREMRTSGDRGADGRMNTSRRLDDGRRRGKKVRRSAQVTTCPRGSSPQVRGGHTDRGGRAVLRADAHG